MDGTQDLRERCTIIWYSRVRMNDRRIRNIVANSLNCNEAGLVKALSKGWRLEEVLVMRKGEAVVKDENAGLKSTMRAYVAASRVARSVVNA